MQSGPMFLLRVGRKGKYVSRGITAARHIEIVIDHGKETTPACAGARAYRRPVTPLQADSQADLSRKTRENSEHTMQGGFRVNPVPRLGGLDS